MPEKRYEGRPLLDKLGIKPGMRVAVINIEDESFTADLRERTEDITLGRPLPQTDAVFLGVDGPGDVAQMGGLRDQMEPNGAIWTVFRKGQKQFNENDVLRLGLESGLVDVKVVRFSDTHTALKFVIRKAER